MVNAIERVFVKYVAPYFGDGRGSKLDRILARAASVSSSHLDDVPHPHRHLLIIQPSSLAYLPRPKRPLDAEDAFAPAPKLARLGEVEDIHAAKTTRAELGRAMPGGWPVVEAMSDVDEEEGLDMGGSDAELLEGEHEGTDDEDMLDRAIGEALLAVAVTEQGSEEGTDGGEEEWDEHSIASDIAEYGSDFASEEGSYQMDGEEIAAEAGGEGEAEMTAGGQSTSEVDAGGGNVESTGAEKEVEMPAGDANEDTTSANSMQEVPNVAPPSIVVIPPTPISTPVRKPLHITSIASRITPKNNVAEAVSNPVHTTTTMPSIEDILKMSQIRLNRALRNKKPDGSFEHADAMLVAFTMTQLDDANDRLSGHRKEIIREGVMDSIKAIASLNKNTFARRAQRTVARWYDHDFNTQITSPST